VKVASVDRADPKATKFVLDNVTRESGTESTTRHYYSKVGDWIVLNRLGDAKFDPPKPFLPVQPKSEGSWSWSGSIDDGGTKYKTEEKYKYRLTNGDQSIAVTGPNGTFTYRIGVGFVSQDYEYNNGTIGGWGSASQKLLDYDLK
jgi:hypothetical protein